MRSKWGFDGRRVEDVHNFISQKFIAIGCCTVVTTRCVYYTCAILRTHRNW